MNYNIPPRDSSITSANVFGKNNIKTLSFTKMHTQLENYESQSYELALKRKEKDSNMLKDLLQKPTAKDVENNLREEAIAAYHNLDINDSLVEDYVSGMIEIVLNDRIEKWQEIKEFKESIDVKKNAKKNSSYEIENSVYNAISHTVENLKIPFDVSLNCNFLKSSSALEIDANLINGINLPQQKEIRGKYGISKVSKVLREKDEETTETVFSLAFYLAGCFFIDIRRINIIKIAIYNEKNEGLCWIKFYRQSFMKNMESKIIPQVDIKHYNYPNVFKFNKTGIIHRLEPIQKADFKGYIKSADNK